MSHIADLWQALQHHALANVLKANTITMKIMPMDIPTSRLVSCRHHCANLEVLRATRNLHINFSCFLNDIGLLSLLSSGVSTELFIPKIAAMNASGSLCGVSMRRDGICVGLTNMMVIVVNIIIALPCFTASSPWRIACQACITLAWAFLRDMRWSNCRCLVSWNGPFRLRSKSYTYAFRRACCALL